MIIELTQFILPMCLTTGITLAPWKLLVSECQPLMSFKRGDWSPKKSKEWLPKKI